MSSLFDDLSLPDSFRRLEGVRVSADASPPAGKGEPADPGFDGPAGPAAKASAQDDDGAAPWGEEPPPEEDELPPEDDGHPEAGETSPFEGDPVPAAPSAAIVRARVRAPGFRRTRSA